MQLYRSCKILLKRIFHFKEKVMPWNIKLLVDLWVEVQKFWMILNWKFSLLKWELPSSLLLKDLGVSAGGILFYFTASEEDDGCTVLMFSHSNNRKNNKVMWFQVLSQTSGNTVNTLRCQESEKDNLSYWWLLVALVMLVVVVVVLTYKIRFKNHFLIQIWELLLNEVQRRSLPPFPHFVRRAGCSWGWRWTLSSSSRSSS